MFKEPLSAIHQDFRSLLTRIIPLLVLLFQVQKTIEQLNFERSILSSGKHWESLEQQVNDSRHKSIMRKIFCKVFFQWNSTATDGHKKCLSKHLLIARIWIHIHWFGCFILNFLILRNFQAYKPLDSTIKTSFWCIFLILIISDELFSPRLCKMYTSSDVTSSKFFNLHLLSHYQNQPQNSSSSTLLAN